MKENKSRPMRRLRKRRLTPNSDGIEEPDEVPAEYELVQEDSLVSENVTD